MLSFTVTHRDPSTRARAGTLTTPHGTVSTPVFMPVGTKGAVKTLTPQQLHEIRTQIVLANAYHLTLRPGEETIKKLGGLHKFMSWDGPILTDSGGYQVFSLARLAKVTEEGVAFQSHIDGKALFLTPEKVVAIQQDLGVDIMMPLDQPAPYPSDKTAARDCMERTHRWLARSKKAINGTSSLFGIVQGATFPDLRAESAREVAQHDLPGTAIGGLSMGEPKPLTWEMLEATTDQLPQDKPRYLMGVGKPTDIVRAVAAGVDMFDCILPSRLGRNGWAFTEQGIVKIRNKKYELDARPLDETCDCFACRSFSRAYLRHLFVVEEILGLTMISLHNVYFYIRLMERIRNAILSGTFKQLLNDADDTRPD